MIPKLSILAIAAIAHAYFFGVYMLGIWVTLKFQMEPDKEAVRNRYISALDVVGAHKTFAIVVIVVALVVFFGWYLAESGEYDTLMNWLLGLDKYDVMFR